MKNLNFCEETSTVWRFKIFEVLLFRSVAHETHGSECVVQTKRKLYTRSRFCKNNLEKKSGEIQKNLEKTERNLEKTGRQKIGTSQFPHKAQYVRAVLLLGTRRDADAAG
jgi:hypothetical protein